MRRVLPSAGPAHPNVLLLVIDTQRADHLSSYAYGRPTTPRLDSLAKEGVLFERAHSPASWTLPSHASLFTGRWPHEHHAGDPLRPFLDGRYPTLAEALRDSGYATGAFVANTFWVGRQVGLQRGFTRFEDFLLTAADVPFTPLLGRKVQWEVAPKWGWVDLPGRRRADFMHRRLLGWLDDVGNRPFFAFVNYMDVHGPFLAPPPFSTMFSKSDARTKVTEIELAPTTVEASDRLKTRLQESIDSYDGSLAYLDHEIGNLLDTLEKRRVANDTLVIVTSDHGESFGEHGLVNHGNSLYLDQTHVPLIIRFPARVPAGVRDGRPVSLTALPATVLRLIGVTDQRFSGPSVMEQAVDRSGVQAAMTEVARRRAVPNDWPSARGSLKSLVTDRWHFIVSEPGAIELYDVTNDMGELRNLAGAAEQAPLVASFRAMLQRMLNDPLTP
jgi:arylsulfatase A-like enzyme